jgi:diguanylate cyclase (GGDEF)-like protein
VTPTESADPPVAAIEALERGCRDADRAGDIPRVHALAERAIEEARQTRDEALLARAQCWMAHAHLYRGALRECLVLAAQTEAVARRAGDDLASVRLCSLIGNCEFQLAQHAAARETLEAGIALADAHGFAVQAATMRGTLGSVLGAMGRFDEGEAAFNTSIAGLEAAGEEHRRLRVYGNLAGLLRRRAESARASGDEAVANATFAKAIDVARFVYDAARQSNDAGQLPYSLGMLGALYRSIGDLDGAERHLRESLALGESAANRRLIAMGALDLARVLRDKAEARQALAMLARAREAALAGNLAQQVGECWAEEAAVQELRGDFRAALDSHRQFHAAEIERLAAERARIEQSRGALDEIRRLRRETALLQRKAAAAEEQARHDPLTSLLNRAGFDAEARPLLERSQGEGRAISMAWIDVDRFKLVNDRFGHAVGDVVLATVGRMLRQQLRSGDLAARQGGDEFVVLIRDTDRDSAARSFARLHEAVRTHAWEQIAPGLAVTVSVSCAQWRDGEALDELARRADDAMYAAKRAGRNQVGSA